VTSDGQRGRSNPTRGDQAPKTLAGSASGLGPALNLDDAVLDDAAQVTPVDVATAKAVWRTAAPAKLRDLLDAGSG
jgi:hypothetical protein